MRGKAVLAVAAEKEEQWRRLCEAIGGPIWPIRPEYRHERGVSRSHRQGMAAELGQVSDQARRVRSGATDAGCQRRTLGLRVIPQHMLRCRERAT